MKDQNTVPPAYSHVFVQSPVSANANSVQTEYVMRFLSKPRARPGWHVVLFKRPEAGVPTWNFQAALCSTTEHLTLGDNIVD